MFLVNSRLGLLIATLNGFGGNSYTAKGTPFPKLRGYFAEFFVTDFSRSPWNPLPIYQRRFAVRSPAFFLENFLGSLGSATTPPLLEAPHQLSGLTPQRICQSGLPTALAGHIQSSGWPTLLRPPIGITNARWYWNMNQLSIAYALRPRLRPD